MPPTELGHLAISQPIAVASSNWMTKDCQQPNATSSVP